MVPSCRGGFKALLWPQPAPPSVVETASILGVTPDAVKIPLATGNAAQAGREDGTVYVRLDGDGPDGRYGRATGRQTDQPTVVHTDALRSENELLRRELEAWQEEARRRDHIIMNMTEAMKALSPPEQEAPQKPRGSPRRPP